MTTVALTIGVACTSETHTTAVVTSSAGGGSGGSSSETSGESAGTIGNAGSESATSGGFVGQAGSGQAGSNPAGTAGTAGTGDCIAGALLAPGLHAACIEDLGQGKFRFRYDFANADQGLDWTPSSAATVTVKQHALVVVSALTDIGVAIFKKKLHVDRASYRVSLLSGTTSNWYINTIWSGSWNPDAGYGGYHDQTGRGFIINGTEFSPGDVAPVSVGTLYDVSVAQSDTELIWDQGGTAMTQAVGPLPVTDRVFAIGAWQSSAAFYDVVFEGTLD